MAEIEYRDIHKAFDVPVLTGVDLKVASGETLAIVGPSGTGKSVLLKTTIGLIEPDQGALETSAALGAPVVELHTGAWCEALAAGDAARAAAEFARIRNAAALGASLGLEIHAGHGLDYASAETISALPEIAELNIGHFLVGEAIFVGLGNTIARMRAAIDRGRAAAPGAAA